MIEKEYKLNEGTNFLRITNNSQTDDLTVVCITPHDGVFDGYEITVLLERPLAQDRYVAIGMGASGLKNIRPKEEAYSLIVKNTALEIELNREKIARYIWDAKKSQWIEIARSLLHS